MYRHKGWWVISQAGELNSGNSIIPGSVPIIFVENSGTATASSNILNVLGSNGITTSGSGNTITISNSTNPLPNSVINIVEDFLPYGLAGASGLNGTIGWYALGTGVGNRTTVSNAHPGIAAFTSVSAPNTSGIYLNDGAPHGMFIMGGGVLSANWVINLTTLSTGTNRYQMSLGLSDISSGVSLTNGIYFTYQDNVNGGNWVGNCTSGNVTTSLNSAIAGSTNFINLGFTVNAAGTSVNFIINGTSFGSIVTNIPLAAINPYAICTGILGNTAASIVDLFYLSQTLTVAR